jgi:hypothetical protein
MLVVFRAVFCTTGCPTDNRYRQQEGSDPKGYESEKACHGSTCKAAAHVRHHRPTQPQTL